MTATAATHVRSNPTIQPWPAHGLESVPECPLCGTDRRELLYSGLTDRVFFCAPGEWALYRCVSCRAAYLDPRPTAATIALAYNRYYTHGATSEPGAVPRSSVGRLKLALKHGYLSARYGVTHSPSLRLGRFLVPLFVRHRLGLDRWVRHLPEPAANQRLLDIGCGNGRFLALAKWLGWDAHGLDPDPMAIEAALRAGHSATLGSLPRTSFSDESFDVVTLSHMIEHAPDPARCLDEVYRLLKPGGRVWIATPNLDGYSRLRFTKDWLALDPPRHLVLFTREALEQACRRAGFANVTRHRTLLSDYATSLALARGRDPWEHVDLDTVVAHGKPALTMAQRAEAAFALVAALILPTLSDEVILTAEKVQQ